MKKLLFILFVSALLLDAWLFLAARQDEPVQPPETPAQDGRLPGDDIPARDPCFIPEEEIQEDYENEKIEAALLEQAARLDSVTVTHYCICEKCCGKSPDHPAYGITASGRPAVPSVSVAVDRSIIPLGSDVLVDYGDGEIHYYRADDTGSGIKGNHIDLCVSSHEEALALGVRTATVYYIKEETT